MTIELIGLVSILEGKWHDEVINLWKLMEGKYETVGIQQFDHPHLTFQGGMKTNKNDISKELQEFASKIKPFNIEIDGFSHFDDMVIYLEVKKSRRLLDLNRKCNKFLKKYCDVITLYTPESWIPHITIAMDDLTPANFKKAWGILKNREFRFKQTLHNLHLIKIHSDGHIGIEKSFELV
jgi:2'-5' RNA ligase